MRSNAVYVMLALVMLVSGCVSVQTNECAVFREIVPEVSDVDTMSDRLAIELEAHNQKYDKYCK